MESILACKTRLLSLVVVFLALPAHAVQPVATAEQTTATRDAIRDALGNETEFDALNLIRKTEDVFRVPICFEWSYVDQDRHEAELPRVPFTIAPGESLEEVLDRFCLETANMFQWGRIRGIICVWPTGTDGPVETMLDVSVTLDVKNVTAWEALLEVARQVNTSASEKNKRFLIPRPTFVKEIYAPPLSFREERVVSINLQDISAREAICEIIASSRLRISFWYDNYYRPGNTVEPRPSANLRLWFHDETGELIHGPRIESPRDYAVWRVEADATVPALESSVEKSK